MGVVERMRRQRSGTALLWAVFGVAIVTGAGIAVNVLTDNFDNPWAWLLVAVLVVVSGWLVYRQAPALPHPVSIDALVEEAVLRGAVSNWLIRVGGNVRAEWILDRVREALNRPALIPPRQASNALMETEKVYADFLARHEQIMEDYRKNLSGRLPEAEVAEAIVAPLQAALPDDREYREALEHVRDADRRDALERAYDRHRGTMRVDTLGLATSHPPPTDNPRQDDPWACLFLWLLADFGDKNTLLPLLEARLNSDTIPPDAIEETLKLARNVMPDDEFRAWLRHIRRTAEGGWLKGLADLDDDEFDERLHRYLHDPD